MPSPSEGGFQIRFHAPLGAARVGSYERPPKKAGPAAGPQKPALWNEGYAEGRSAVEKELREKVQRAESALLAAVSQLRTAWDAETKAIEPQVVDLALAIAKSVLKKEVDLKNYDIRAIVAEVLDSLRGEELSLTVRLNPEDHATISQGGSGTPWTGVQLLADPSVPRASCAVDTSYGRIVREVDSLLAEVQSTLSESRKAEGAA